MAKYAEIRKFVQRHHGFVPKTGWIAHIEEIRGLARSAPAARRVRSPVQRKSGRPSKRRSAIFA
jgi:hypothetical protein